MRVDEGEVRLYKLSVQWSWLLAPVALLGQLVARGQTIANANDPGAVPRSESRAQVEFRYENPQLQPARYSFVIEEGGTGKFHSEPGLTPPPDTADYHPLPNSLDRSIQLSEAATSEIFATARSQGRFAIGCEDTRNKVAFQGTKQLSYQGADGRGSCTYNWSKYPPIQKLTSLFESIAFTLEEGRRLEVEHKHDRLALDAELGTLVDAVKSGEASEIENIRPVLQAIIDDEATLERAKSRAQKLLGGAEANRAALPPM
jgi:hypothetical protein